MKQAVRVNRYSPVIRFLILGVSVTLALNLIYSLI